MTIENKCRNCLIQTEEAEKGLPENLSEGNQIWTDNTTAEMQRLKQALKEYNPSSILEIGSGAGRIIQGVRETLLEATITGVEKNQEMFSYLQGRFSEDRNVQLIQGDINNYLGQENYDLILCMMNTFGNIDNPEILKKILEQSQRFILTLYNRDFNIERDKMYEARGHKDYEIKNGTFYFYDDWVKGLTSKSYSQQDIKTLVKQAQGEIQTLEEMEIMYYVEACKR
jgi:SAM-dependent methyltransferase